MQPSATKWAMVGEYGGMGAFVKGKEWVPGKCHAYLENATPSDQASTYLQMLAQITALKVTRGRKEERR